MKGIAFFRQTHPMNQRNSPLRRSRPTRHAFTLVEVLVALGILAILLVIIVLPLRLGFDSFNKGNAQALTQSALQTTMTDMEKDFRQAVYVFPNARVANITNKPPYTNQPVSMNGPYDARLPYYLSTDTTNKDDPTGVVCGGNVINWSNPARLDMIQVRRDVKGNILTPLAPSYNIVTYYARRQDMSKLYDPVDNPVVMYRAEYPAFGISTVSNAPDPLKVASGAFNAKIDVDRINFRAGAAASTECTSASSVTARSSQWLSHNYYGETDLLPLVKIARSTVTTAPAQYRADSNYDISNLDASYSHTLAIPRGLALEATNGFRAVPGYTGTPSAQGALVPDTSFTTSDTNSDGKIDRVTISLGLASFEVGAQGQFDATTQQPKGTVLRGTRTIDLPNIK